MSLKCEVEKECPHEVILNAPVPAECICAASTLQLMLMNVTVNLN